MKMVKSLLLGSAAGLVAMAGAQAADLPVKAKPVQYVKICSLYGAGFYYIPGTDMCIKIGGWVRAEYGWGRTVSSTLAVGEPDVNNRATNNSWWRVAATSRLMPVTRPNTARCAATSRLASAPNDRRAERGANQFSANRAFIQLAGFTFGLAQSFFDFYAGAATAYLGYFPRPTPAIGLERHRLHGAVRQRPLGHDWCRMRRRTQIIDTTQAAYSAARPACNVARRLLTARRPPTAPAPTAAAGSGHRRQPARRPGLGFGPDHGCLHQVNANYYINAGTSVAYQWQRHPGDKWGFAVGGGLKFNAPMIGPGDFLQSQVDYSQGACATSSRTRTTTGASDGQKWLMVC